MNIDDIIENAQLKGRIIALDAQVETLTAEVRCLEAVIRSHERVDCLLVKSLKEQLLEVDAKVERLTKAGGDLVTWVLIMRHNNPNDIEDIRLVILNWNAAKEGKRS